MDEKNNKDWKLSHVIIVLLITASILSIYIYNEVLLKEDDFELEYDWTYYGVIAETSYEFTTNLTQIEGFFETNNLTGIASGLNHNETQLFSSAKWNVNGTIVTVLFRNNTSTQSNNSHLNKNNSFNVDQVLVSYYSLNSHIFDTLQEVENSSQYLLDKDKLEIIAHNVSDLIESWFGASTGAIEITPLITYLH